MTKEVIDALAKEPKVSSDYILDSEMRELAIVWAVHVRNENKLFEDSEYAKLLNNMRENNPELYNRFRDYLIAGFDNGGTAEWSVPAESIRKTLLPKE